MNIYSIGITVETLILYFRATCRLWLIFTEFYISKKGAWSFTQCIINLIFYIRSLVVIAKWLVTAFWGNIYFVNTKFFLFDLPWLCYKMNALSISLFHFYFSYFFFTYCSILKTIGSMNGHFWFICVNKESLLVPIHLPLN